MRYTTWERNPEDAVLYTHLGQLWLDLAKLHRVGDDELDLPDGGVLTDTFTIFVLGERVYEVQGHDREHHRLWIMDVTPQDTPAASEEAADTSGEPSPA